VSSSEKIATPMAIGNAAAVPELREVRAVKIVSGIRKTMVSARAEPRFQRQP
jgi:hypothetical protein